jgi:hypothetical protein
MIQDEDIEVLAELSRIAARYGPDSVIRLANLIRDPVRAEELASVLERVASHAPQRLAHSKSEKVNRVGMGVLNSLRESNPEKHALIAALRDHLVSGTILGSMGELRHFARTHDLSIGKASSRSAAIAPLLQSTSELPALQIANLLDTLVQPKVDDRSLERWRNVIVKPRPHITE